MGERIRRMNAKQVEKILQKYGFELISQKGSQRKQLKEKASNLLDFNYCGRGIRFRSD